YASGYLQYATGRREDAIASLQRAIALDPDNDAAHRLLGWRLYANQGRMDDAVAELRKAVAIRPDSFENHYRLGTVLYLAGRYPEAVDAYRRATERQPPRADARGARRLFARDRAGAPVVRRESTRRRIGGDYRLGRGASRRSACGRAAHRRGADALARGSRHPDAQREDLYRARQHRRRART